MTRSRAFRDLVRAARIATYCERYNLTTEQGIARLAEKVAQRRTAKQTRREFLGGLGKAAMLGLASATLVPLRPALGARRPPNVDVAIVGGGIAGLASADTLQEAGINATIYEARDRLGGRWAVPSPAPSSFSARWWSAAASSSTPRI